MRTDALEVKNSAEAVAAEAADRFVAAASAAIEARGRFGVALAGGSTPLACYALLARAPRRNAVDWSRVHLFWGDERCVPPDDPESNYGSAARALLDHLPVPPAAIHRIRGEIAPDRAAAEYEATLLSWLDEGEAGGGSRGALDLVLLGLGSDGHTASIFPGTDIFRRELDGVNPRRRWVVPVFAQSQNRWRVTFTTVPINQAREVLFLVTGPAKAATLREVLAPPGNAIRFPAQLIRPVQGRLRWLVDEAAAAEIPRHRSVPA